MWRPFCRSEAYERVLRIETGGGKGAAFTIDRHDRQWLITAKHLLPGDDPAPECKLSRRDGSASLRLGFLADLGGRGDVAVAPLESPVTPQLELHATSEGVQWSQIVYFLGFPYGMATETGVPGDELAFVKQAIISASRRISESLSLWYLDGYNNPGFSGGPVVASTEKFETMQVIGVVFGNRSSKRPIEVEKRKIHDAVVPENTGIIMATDIRYATDLIDATLGST